MAVFRHGPLELKRVSNTPQRLKPQLHLRLYGTTEVVPFHKLQSCPSTNSSRALPQTPVVPFHKLQSCPSPKSSCPSTRLWARVSRKVRKSLSPFLQFRSHGAVRRPVLRNDSSAFAEAVGFSAPEESAAAEAGHPGKEAQHVTDGIEPREIQSATIADDSPSDRDRLHHPVDEGRSQ